MQLRWPFARGANSVPLVEAQRNVRAYGACDQRGRFYARPPSADEPLEPDWRPIDPATDVFEECRDDGSARPWPEDRSVLCWWLPTFWGAPEDPDPDPDRRVVIDVGAVLDDRDLHAALQRGLGLPSFHGRNWDAFRDAVTGLVALPAELRFTGWPALERRAPRSAARLREQLARVPGGLRALRRPLRRRTRRTGAELTGSRVTRGQPGPPGPPRPGPQVRVNVFEGSEAGRP